MSNWYTDRLCDKCGGKIATNGTTEWCENCKVVMPITEPEK